MNLQQNLKILSLAAHKRAARAAAAASNPSGKAQKIVIDFSSPNIAKPFHFGHLKSTILGNFLANLNSLYGNHVIKLNYIGDWGTQYGLLSLGLDSQELSSLNDDKKKTPLERLLDVYVAANSRGSEDEEFYNKARERFRLMDSGEDVEQLAKWRQIRDISLNELQSAYKQLGIHFDVFDYESDYSRKSHDLIEQMRQLDQLIQTEDGVLVTEVIKNNRALRVPLLKSDGSTLYITRDIAAAIHRKQQHEFDRMYYVVGANQEKHFHSLSEILSRLGHSWARDLVHVKMGKVKGMSSRMGEAVLLSRIIEEATRVYEEATRNVPTSKVSEEADVERVGKQLALSAMYVYDMRNKRTRDYEFKWDQVMVPGERTGIHLQTSYARLCSLREKARQERDLEPYESTDEINYDAVCCIAGVHLINVMNDLARKLHESYETLDPSPLVNHALLLCKAANRARQSDWLHVMHENEPQRARSRLTLFESARGQLELLIRLIGLQPLEKV